MHLYGLRLLVALLTFGVGVAANWLLSFKHPVQFERRYVLTAPVLVAAPSIEEEPPPPPHACNLIVSGGVLNGNALSRPMPAYPTIAKAARAEGTVVVRIVIDESGNVMSAMAVSGHPLLQQAAVDAARQATFSPTRLSGRPVKVSGVITYNFVLE
ncbi:MAG: periplasmic protein TonB [Acidobacteriota bacterium]|jgi:TonB family protein|nr:periplasmic protein TonB [Acidobacteriota bacterium]